MHTNKMSADFFDDGTKKMAFSGFRDQTEVRYLHLSI